MTQKAVDEMVIGLAARVSVVKIVAVENFVLEAVEIDGNGIDREMALSQLDIVLVLLQVAMMEFGISCLDIIVSHVQPC